MALRRIWLHIKSGHLYEEIARGCVEATNEPCMIYRRLALPDSTMWVRPVSNFMDGRFQQVERKELKADVGR
jgi:hypothetical protein